MGVSYVGVASWRKGGCMGDFVLFPSVSCVKWPPPTLLG